MILRRPVLTATSTAISAPTTPQIPLRHLHTSLPIRPIPKPTPFIPTHTAFLSAIGRNLSAHATKIASWNALFTLTSLQLKELGVEPARSRKYLLQWRERFRNGEYGIGGDCPFVNDDGVAELLLVEAPVPLNPELGNTMSPRSARASVTRDPGIRRVVVNVPEGSDEVPGQSLDGIKGVAGVTVRGAGAIVGSYVERVKGSEGRKARVKRTEGIWEVSRGHTVDGGERRRAEVRAKRRAAENKEKNR